MTPRSLRQAIFASLASVAIAYIVILLANRYLVTLPIWSLLFFAIAMACGVLLSTLIFYASHRRSHS